VIRNQKLAWRFSVLSRVWELSRCPKHSQRDSETALSRRLTPRRECRFSEYVISSSQYRSRSLLDRYEAYNGVHNPVMNIRLCLGVMSTRPTQSHIPVPNMP
jgi:hypothetical protein